ncbi:hypothetical protein DY000_02006347 [Brassica cretica]|uniref:Uncharacterized protein n=1 Tax=Brassica cretica TaxID=69181 RepID=A0ABQ7CKR6_BRACR|nr:hypothetical protein DY000_02006347 [Brassica cretica]
MVLADIRDLWETREVFHFPRGRGRSWGPDPEYFIVGNRGSFSRGSWEPGFLPAGIQRPVSCLGSGGIQYLSIFPQQFAPYCSISSSNSWNNLCTQVNRSFSFPVGFPQAGHRSSSPAIPGDGKLWASDVVLETAEPGALMFFEEELYALMCGG